MKSFKDILELISEKKQDTFVANKPLSLSQKMPWYLSGENPLKTREMSKVPEAPKEAPKQSQWSYGHMSGASTTSSPAPTAKPESKVIKMGPSTPSSSATPQTRPQSGSYTAQKDESIESIAKKHGMSTDELMALNKDKRIKDPSKVNPGTQLRTKK